jgi:hypothetical protein
MPSELAWVDTSEDERRRMREVIDLFRERDTLDELGIGSVRDMFAEYLFPGLSTIQTRARYFFFLPWVYKQLEQDQTSSAKAAKRARRLQTELVDALVNGSPEGETGIIGRQAREHVQRLPSSVYWSGLGTYGLRQFHGSIEDYHRSLDGFHRRLRRHHRGEGDELHERLPTNWHPSLPQPPDDLFDETSFDLTAEEATFLRERIIFSRPESLFAHLLAKPPTSVLPPTPWDHPAAVNLPPLLSTWLHHARTFSDVMHGAALAYNLMLAELADERNMGPKYQGLSDMYSADVEDWAEEMSAKRTRLVEWDLTEFWDMLFGENSRIPQRTRLFVTRWVELVKDDPQHVATLPSNVRLLLEEREVFLKRGQARLKTHRALELWTGQSGTAPLTYRWPTASLMLADIQAGLAHA